LRLFSSFIFLSLDFKTYYLWLLSLILRFDDWYLTALLEVLLSLL